MPNLQERLAMVFPPPHRRGLQAEIARACGVKPPTVFAWFNKPEKVSSLDRATAETICERFAPAISPRWLAENVGTMHIDMRHVEPPVPERFRQRHEVTPSDFGLLEDVLLVMTDAEVKHIRERARHARDAMARDEKLRKFIGADRDRQDH